MTAPPMTQTMADTDIAPDEDVRIGPLLAEKRIEGDLEIADVASELRIPGRYLKAIETMQVGPIPKGYLTVYLRAYATRLGFDADDIVVRFTRQCGAVAEAAAPQPVPQFEPPKRSLMLPAAAGALVVAVLAGFSLIAYDAFRSERATPELRTAAQAVNGARRSLFDETPAARPASQDLPLTIHAVRDSWIEIRGRDGTVFRERVMAEGERYFPRVGAGWTVSAADGGAFEWRVGDVVVGALGPEGAPVYSISIDAAAAEAEKAAAPELAATPGEASPR